MYLSEVVRTCVASHFRAQLVRETLFGQSNQADFSGVSSWLGNIRVELERRREDPVNNVVKAWRQASERPQEPPFALVHVFSGFYSTWPAKLENARFIGQMMGAWADVNGRGIRYVAVSFDFVPPSGDADPDVPESIAKQISQEIRRQLEDAVPAPTQE